MNPHNQVMKNSDKSTNPGHNERIQPSVNQARRIYDKPQLTKHGTMKSITRSSGGSGGDGGSQMVA